MKNDARVRYTRHVLKSSLLRLMEEKPINRITVKEVCDLSGLNRATFYSHYTDCFDLLEQIENEMLDEFSASLELLRSFDVTEMIGAVYSMIENNISLCRIIIFKNQRADIIDRMIEMARERSIAYWRQNLKKASDNELEMLFTCLANGLMSVVVKGYGKYSREELTEFISTTVRNSVTLYL